MKRKLLLCIALVLFANHIFAVPALRFKKNVKMEDGTSIEVLFCGDENGSYHITSDGFLVEPIEGTDFFVKTTKKLNETNVLDNEEYAVRRRIGSQSTAPLKSKGSPNIPVILVNFSDVKFTVGATANEINSYYDLFCNGTRNGVLYTGAGSHGAIKDYFIAQSDSIFQPEFTVIGPVTLDNSMAFYGANSTDGGKDKNYAQFRTDAIRKAMVQFSNWDAFDNDHNGTIDIVYFIFAGLGESNGGGPNTIWPKESTASTTINGRVFATSACCNELRAEKKDSNTGLATKTKPDGIGIMCHELSHALGLPDFYDTRNIAFGMDFWSIMDYGCYAKDGYMPCAYNAYERDFMGWRKLVDLNNSQTVSLLPIEKGGLGYKITNDANTNEYYILENRQRSGWDLALSTLGHGMLVVHVDYNTTKWNSNTVNTEKDRQRLTIIPANNQLIGGNNAATLEEWMTSLGGNPFPGTSGITALTDESTPAAIVYTGDKMNKPIKQIQEVNSIVSFKFMPQGILNIPMPQTNLADVTDRSFRIKWDRIPFAQEYILELYSADQSQELDSEQLILTDTISSLSYTVTNIMPAFSYSYRLRAIADTYENSPFSPIQRVQTLPDAIQTIGQDEQSKEVYTLQGVYRGILPNDEFKALSPGVYLIRSAAGVRKIIVK